MKVLCVLSRYAYGKPERGENYDYVHFVAAFERNAQAVTDRMAKLDEKGWTKQGQFLMAGAPPWKDTIENFVWGMFFDAIHHRGQLTTYLRPMGGKVPSIYGPSADDPGGA